MKRFNDDSVKIYSKSVSHRLCYLLLKSLVDIKSFKRTTFHWYCKDLFTQLFLNMIRKISLHWYQKYYYLKCFAMDAEWFARTLVDCFSVKIPDLVLTKTKFVFQMQDINKIELLWSLLGIQHVKRYFLLVMRLTFQPHLTFRRFSMQLWLFFRKYVR